MNSNLNSDKILGMNKFLNINKPVGITSHDVVDSVRRSTGVKKVGHAGTLDPMASGVLIVAVGRNMTKRIDEIKGQNKEYVAVIRLDGKSDTDDAEGIIELLDIKKIPTDVEVQKVINTFIGEIDQVPPIYSAKKIAGKKSYELARKGQPVILKPSKVKILKIELLEYSWPELALRIECGTGTYIRSLARDIGEKLGTGGYLTQLVRTRIGEFKIENSILIEDLTQIGDEEDD